MQNAQNSKDANEYDPRSSFPTVTPGQKLAGCYLLKEEKHVSDTSSIWLAHDEVLGRDVSLHFIPQSIRKDEKAMDELRHLTKRNRQLIHPSILRIYDFIEENVWAAISTDVLAGESMAELRAKKAGGFFEVADVKPWLVQICQTVDDAHKIQLVHGDLSLDHLFVDQAGRVVATNFGLGRCVRDAVWRAAGAKGGTPPVENLSPQLLDGQAATPADDVYATGVLLHELLAGQAPFTEPDIADKIRTTAAPKLMERRSELKRAGGPIPPSWEKVIASCLEKSCEQRPKSLVEISGKLGLPKAEEKTSEAPMPASQVEAAASAPAVEGEPVIPVVKKAWVGSKSPAAPLAGPIVARASGDFADVNVDVTDSGDLDEHEPAFRNALNSDYPLHGSRRSGFPVTGVAAAAILGGLCVYTVFFGGFRKTGKTDPAPVVRAEYADGPQYAPVKNTISVPLPAAEPAPASIPDARTVPVAKPKTVIASAPVEIAKQIEPSVVPAMSPQPETHPALTLAANTKAPKNPAPTKNADAPVATPIPVAGAPSDGGSNPSVAAKTAALEAARKSVEEWDKAHASMLKKKEHAEAAIAEAKKALNEKMKAVAPMLKASDEVAALRQQREEEMRSAELAAIEAKKIADEKVRLAEEAKKAALNVDKENKDKLAGQKKAEAELDEIKKAIAENERLAAESAKLADGAFAKKGEQIVVVKQKEQEVAMAMAAAEIEAQKRAELEEKRTRIMKEMDDAKRLFEERMKALESSLKNPESAAPASTPASEKPPVAPKPIVPATPPPAAVVPATPAPVVAAPSAPALPAPDSTLLAKMEKTTTPPVVEPRPPAPANEVPATNSLGIGFAPVGDVQFAVWPTRVKDFEAFATATGLKSSLWRDPGFKQGPDHPVVNVTWLEAVAFCKWLTFKEQRDGTLPAGKAYRLPTDLEWSKAVGLPEENGKTAEARDMGVPDVYPWGTAWPPPQGAGNYTGEETGSDVAIKGYSDGFPWTSPVGNFPPNKYGLYDMGGNVWQWVVDQWNTDSTSKVLRGASWYNGALKLSLLSSCRVHAAQDSSTDNYGFRCVIANDSAKALKR